MGNVPANGYAIVCVLLLSQFELSVRFVFTHRNLAPCAFQLGASKLLGCYMVKPHGQLVQVSS
ncbi:hypothetical protein NHG95_09635, partial [Pseudomonas corrugata]|uniref:hypothetical protein n=1 Tax=Pseudomonas corrugata TaxID=47879 RepID=UPI0028C4FFA2